MSIKDQIRAEIERRKNEWQALLDKGNAVSPKIVQELINEDLNILTFLDSIPEQPASEELEEKDFVEEVRQYYSNNCTWDALKQPMLSIITRCARHFAEWMKAKMLEDAVEGVAEELYNDGEPQCTIGVGTYFQPGEEVYVIEKEKYK